jgi:diguanylate cyclase (GGDEF)-like protein
VGTLVSVNALNDIAEHLPSKVDRQPADFRVIDHIGRPVFDTRNKPPALWVDSTTEGVRKCLDGVDGLSEYEDGYGNSVLGAHRSISPYGLGLLLETDVELAYSTVNDLRTFGVSVSTAAALLVIVLGYVLVISMLRPIIALTKGAMAVAEGDLTVEIPVSSNDEIGYLTRVFNNMTGKLRSIHATLEQMSMTDELTGLYNRRLLSQALAAELNRAKRTGDPMSLFMMDVDHFKAFNDRFGHLRGDDFLKGLGAFLTSRVRKMDIAARYGGEEFVLVLPGVDKKQARLKADSLREDFSNQYLAGEDCPSLTVSIGISTCPEDGDGAEELMECADSRLYQAKHQGRNRVVATDDEEVGLEYSPS